MTELTDAISLGLPVYQLELDDRSLPLGIAHLNLPGTPLARFHLRLLTVSFTAWLRHPIMNLVDTLTVRIGCDPETGKQVMFSESDIEAIDACRAIDNTYLLRLCGPRIADFKFLADGLLSNRVWLDYVD